MRLQESFFICIVLGCVSISAQSQLLKKTLPVKRNIENYKPYSAADTNVIVVNYDSADSKVWGVNYLPLQTQLMNVHYTSSDSSLVNQEVINYFTVAFDSIIDPYKGVAYPPDSLGGIIIDTLIIPLIHVNYSGSNDTLEIQLNTVDSLGYPTSTILQDRWVISNLLGSSNNNSAISYIKIPENYQLTKGIKFAATVKYYGSKTDSCWFTYGCGTFIGTCDSTGPYTLAQGTDFSKVLTSNSSFKANSFVLYNKYKTAGLYPTDSGAQLFVDCNNDGVFTSGIDGASYFQNIDVFAMVSTIPLVIEPITANNFVVGQNQPNPFNQRTTINYSLTKHSDVQFSVCDMMGRKIMSKEYSRVTPGQHNITLTASEFPVGVYFYSFNVDGYIITKKMVITQ